MTLSTDRSTLARLQREISDLRSKEATEVRKQGELTKRMHSASGRATKATSASMLNSHVREAERHARDLESSQARHSIISDRIARKSKEITRLQERISQAEEAERKKQLKAEQKRQREHSGKMRQMEQRIAELSSSVAPLARPPIAPGEKEAHDVFICHASEDKADFVDELATKAEAAGLKVWYDNFNVEWGESLRQKIDHGLAGSYLGVVVLSSSFFAKPWAQYELDGLVQKEMAGEGRVLPIWHKVTLDEVRKASPSLAGRLALNTMTETTDDIVEKLVEMRDKLKGIGA